MARFGVMPSKDLRWAEMAESIIADAEREDVSLHEFYAGLAALAQYLEDRLNIGVSELQEGNE